MHNSEFSNSNSEFNTEKAHSEYLKRGQEVNDAVKRLERDVTGETEDDKSKIAKKLVNNKVFRKFITALSFSITTATILSAPRYIESGNSQTVPQEIIVQNDVITSQPELESKNPEAFIHTDELLDNNYDADSLAEELQKDGSLWLRIDEMLDHGYDINKLADRLQEEGTIGQSVTKLLEHGYDVNLLAEKLRQEGIIQLYADDLVKYGFHGPLELDPQPK